MYVAGNVSGGVFLGLAAAGGSALVAVIATRHVAQAIAAGVVVVYAVPEVTSWPLWRPNSKWQVPAAYRRTPYIGLVAFVWGVALGTGWLTKNATSAFLMFFVASIALPPSDALLAGAVFGLARGLTLTAVVGPKTYEDVVSRLTAIRRHRATPRVGTLVLGALLAAALIT